MSCFQVMINEIKGNLNCVHENSFNHSDIIVHLQHKCLFFLNFLKHFEKIFNGYVLVFSAQFSHITVQQTELSTLRNHVI